MFKMERIPAEKERRKGKKELEARERILQRKIKKEENETKKQKLSTKPTNSWFILSCAIDHVSSLEMMTVSST